MRSVFSVALSPQSDAADHDSSDADSQAHERELVERAQAGDLTAFHALYEAHAGTVHRYAIVPLIGDRALAEDLLADTFVRALENLHRFRWQGRGILPWLIRIGKNLCLDRLRQSGRLGAWPEELDRVLADGALPSAESVVAERELTAQFRERIAACLAEINPRYRKVLELRLVEGASREHAAATMEVSIGTLDVLLFRACKAFRKVYMRRYDEAPDLEAL